MSETFPIQSGLTRLLRNYTHLLKGRSIGIITNQTGVDEQLRDNVSLLAEHSQIKALFSPEHGLTGTAQAGVRISSDQKQLIPVYSLYGQTKQPTEDMLEGLDLLVFDIQDVGARFYTYTWTMYRAMKSAEECGLDFMVLDRPNPIGSRVAGNVSETNFLSFVGQHPIPMQHGMTIGELAQLFNSECNLDIDLKVISMHTNETRNFFFEQADWLWVPPSPNIPNRRTTQLYVGTCLIEGTNLSEGRGTTKPFEWIGAPWLDGQWLATAFNKLDLLGMKARPIQFEPIFSKYKGKVCNGIQLHLTNINLEGKCCSISATLHLLNLVKHQYPDEFQFHDTFFDRLVGSDKLRNTIEEGISVDDLIEDWRQQSLGFQQHCRSYLIY